jgi:hypothetical protein
MKPKSRNDSGISRRNFIKNSVSAAAGLGFLSAGKAIARQGENPSEPMIREYRTLGRTGFKVSDIGTA